MHFEGNRKLYQLFGDINRIYVLFSRTFQLNLQSKHLHADESYIF